MKNLDDIPHFSATPRQRIEEAYLRMAREAKHRPYRDDDTTLAEEARQYAHRFIQEEDSLDFKIGVSDWRTNRALVFTVEAARRLCGVDNKTALALLRMAITEIEEEADDDL